MSLIIKGFLSEETKLLPPEGASKYCLRIESHYLSEPYHLENGSKVYGEIKKIDELSTMGENLKIPNTPITATFILNKLIISDLLFLELSVWEKEFRDYGIIASTQIEVELTEALSGEVKVKLYPKRNVVVE